MKPRAAWPILAKKAKEKCDAAQLAMLKARDKVQQLQNSREKMQTLYQDYLERSKEAERKAHTIAQTMNFRAFMQQIQTLIQRVDVDLQQAQKQLNQCKQALQAAELKRIKMDTLVEQDVAAVRKYQLKREQREMDAAGITLHNLKARSGADPASL
jgi:flagellar export protein FliJ